MKSLVSLSKKLVFKIIILLILFFFVFHSQNFKLDASSDTLILQNDKSFKFFNYYNEIFPSKNFLILAIKSNKKIDIDYINQIENIKSKLIKINGVESVFSILDAPVLLSNSLIVLSFCRLTMSNNEFLVYASSAIQWKSTSVYTY